MINIDLQKLVIDQRKSIEEMSIESGIPAQTLYRIRRANKISMRLLRKLEVPYKNLTPYIITEKEKASA